MKCWLYGSYFDDERDQVRRLPAPCVSSIKKKNLLLFWAWKAGLLQLCPLCPLTTSRFMGALKNSTLFWNSQKYHISHLYKWSFIKSIMLDHISHLYKWSFIKSIMLDHISHLYKWSFIKSIMLDTIWYPKIIKSISHMLSHYN